MFYCHRCGFKGFRSASGQSPKQLLHHLNSLDKESDSVVSTFVNLPSDFTSEIPAKGLSWLRKYGITNELVSKYKIGYSKSYNRVIMPIFNDGMLVYWQGRNLDKPSAQRPKYINTRKMREDVWFVTGDSPVLQPPVVLVEDILSAIVVAQAGYCAISLLGSHLSEALQKKIVREFKDRQVFVWLDPDKRKAALSFARQLRIRGVKARAIITPEQDPKAYTNNQIQTFLENKSA